MKKRFVSGCFIILLIALGAVGGILHFARQRDLSNQMAYLSSADDKLYYLKDVNHPEKAKCVCDEAINDAAWFSEDGKYLYYYCGENEDDENCRTKQLCRIAVADIGMPYASARTKKYAATWIWLTKVRGKDAFLYLDRNGYLILCENGKCRELKKQVGRCITMPDKHGVICEKLEGGCYYLSLDDGEEKLIERDARIANWEEGPDDSLYCWVESENSYRLTFYQITKDGVKNELDHIDDYDDEYIYYTQTYKGKDVVYEREQCVLECDMNYIEDDYVSSKDVDENQLSESEKRDKFIVEGIREYLEDEDHYDENYIQTLCMISNGTRRVVSEDIVSNLTNENVIAYTKYEDDYIKIKMTALLERVKKKIPKNATFKNSSSAIYDTLSDMIMEYNDVRGISCYILLSGKEQKIEVEEGYVAEIQALGDKRFVVQTESYNGECSPALYIVDVEDDEIVSVKKLEDANAELASYMCYGEDLYYLNQSGEVCKISNGKKEVLIEKFSRDDEVGIYKDGTLFWQKGNEILLYKNQSFEKIGEGHPLYLYRDSNSYLTEDSENEYSYYEGGNKVTINDCYGRPVFFKWGKHEDNVLHSIYIDW